MADPTTDKSTMPEQSFGDFLREARERRGLSLADVAAVTKVPLYSLQLIDDADIEDLPAEVFVRGFVRSYARTVGIPDAEPLAMLDRMMGERRRRSEHAAAVASSLHAGGDGDLMPGDALALGFGRDEDGLVPRRGVGLAIFVVIVLVIATITVSYLMRQPPAPGEGLSRGNQTETESIRPKTIG